MNFRFAVWLRLVCCLGSSLIVGSLLSGCKREAATDTDRIPPNPNAPALYGQPIGTVTNQPARLRDPASVGSNWQKAPFFILQTELSPATLVHSETKYLGLFTGLTNIGLSAPSHLAWPTMNGPRTFKRGESLNVTNMAQNWVLVWWSGAEGWTNWDSPWVVFLQHHPESMTLDEAGLHFEFPHAAGDVILMPLYGYEKLPQQEYDFRAENGLPPRKVAIKTWEWPKVVTRDPLTRIRYWSSALREFPLYCEDTFSVDRAKDSVTVRSRFHWRSIEDDWKTPHMKLAPLSPPLGLAATLGGFPVEFSKPWFDLDLPTPFGPYVAVEGVDEFDATFQVLHYVNETEAFMPPATNAHPSVQLALEKLQQWASRGIATDGGASPRRLTGIVGMSEVTWSARALPYLDPATRSNLLGQVRRVLGAALSVSERSTDATPGGARSGEGLLATVWAYAHFSGDWALVKESWPSLRKVFIAPKLSRWSSFGGAGASGADNCASEAICFARLAYCNGDMDTYRYACGVVARELVLGFAKQRGADYFRNHQPWHSPKVIGEEVFVTNLRSDGGGWQFDGPKYPERSDERRFVERWLRFEDFDVARFFRDYLKDDVRRELNWLQRHADQHSNWWSDPGGLPSFVALRSLLLNATPGELASVASLDQTGDSPDAQVARCLSILRSSHSPRFERLIPPGPPSPFIVGVERDVAGPNVQLLAFIGAEQAGHKLESSASVPDWPRLIWPEWTTPTGAVWSFGHIRPVRQGEPRRFEAIPLNWNTRVLRFELP